MSEPLGARGPALRGLALAAAASVLAVALQWLLVGRDGSRYDRARMPGFDAYVYVAMADHPVFFTLPPWGYRLLEPLLVRQLPVGRPRGFRWVALASLAASGPLLFLFFRRLGNGLWPSLAAVVAFGLSPPVRTCLENYFLVEPLTVLLASAFLLALESGAGVAVLALLAALGTVSKEMMLAFVPVVWLARRDCLGDRRALLQAALVAAPAVLLSLVLRVWWTPHVEIVRTELSPAYLGELARAVGRSWPVWVATVPLAGLTPLAALGGLRRPARPFLRRYGYLIAATALLPFLNPAFHPFALPHLDIEYTRYLLLSLPVLLPLCLVALDRVAPHLRPAAVPPPPRRGVQLVALVTLAALLASPFLLLDRYRRAGTDPRFGPLFLARHGGSLRAAGRLAAGRALSWDLDARLDGSRPGARREAWEERWFLDAGWGDAPYDWAKPVAMEGRAATLVLPCFDPAPLELSLRLSAPAPAGLFVAVNGMSLGSERVAPEAREVTFRLDPGTLYRGDNLVSLTGAGEEPRVRLHRYRIEPVGGPTGTLPSPLQGARGEGEG